MYQLDKDSFDLIMEWLDVTDIVALGTTAKWLHRRVLHVRRRFDIAMERHSPEGSAALRLPRWVWPLVRSASIVLPSPTRHSGAINIGGVDTLRIDNYNNFDISMNYHEAIIHASGVSMPRLRMGDVRVLELVNPSGACRLPDSVEELRLGWLVPVSTLPLLIYGRSLRRLVLSVNVSQRNTIMTWSSIVTTAPLLESISMCAQSRKVCAQNVRFLRALWKKVTTEWCRY